MSKQRCVSQAKFCEREQQLTELQTEIEAAGAAAAADTHSEQDTLLIQLRTDVELRAGEVQIDKELLRTKQQQVREAQGWYAAAEKEMQ